MLYSIASHKGITPLNKLTPTTNIARMQTVLSNLKHKRYIEARIADIPIELRTLEELQHDPIQRPRKRKPIPTAADPSTYTPDNDGLENMELA